MTYISPPSRAQIVLFFSFKSDCTGALLLFSSRSPRIIRAFIISASNRHLAAVNAVSCSVAPWLLSVKSITSGPDWLPWKLLAYFCLGFSSLRWLFWSDKYNVVLGAGVEERGADEITSPGSRAAKQQAARQDKNCHERRRKIKGLGNYWHPVLDSGRPEARNRERTCPAVSQKYGEKDLEKKKSPWRNACDRNTSCFVQPKRRKQVK